MPPGVKGTFMHEGEVPVSAPGTTRHHRPPLTTVILVGAATVLAASALGGCGRRVTPVPLPTLAVTAAPSRHPTGTPASWAPVTAPLPSSTSVTRPVPSTSASATGFPEEVAVPCAGAPGADPIIALLRANGWLSARSSVTATTGPLCAGTWQYTVFAVSGHEPLQVVTEGPPTALRLVTAGTDVCTVTVRTTGPAGIVSAAHCPPPSA